MLSREIKFRAKCQSTDVWCYGYFCKDYTDTAFITTIDGSDTTVVDPYTLGQFTGLIDVRGKEVYEGDIVKLTNGGYGFKVGKVVYGAHGDPRFTAEQINVDFPSTYHLQVSPNQIEVIEDLLNAL